MMHKIKLEQFQLWRAVIATPKFNFIKLGELTISVRLNWSLLFVSLCFFWEMFASDTVIYLLYTRMNFWVSVLCKFWEQDRTANIRVAAMYLQIVAETNDFNIVFVVNKKPPPKVHCTVWNIKLCIIPPSHKVLINKFHSSHYKLRRKIFGCFKSSHHLADKKKCRDVLNRRLPCQNDQSINNTVLYEALRWESSWT